MFKSSENLRLAADMRALERVARPWRGARRSWFDGTPESIEARLAATERVLTHARGGVTPAHVELEREASTARAELKEAAHRLMVDFLDDGARAFKGSRRVAGRLPPSHPDNGLSDDPTQRHLDALGDDDPHYDDPYHGKVWPHDFPLPEGTPPKWNDDDTLTCPNCGYDEVELNRRGECPECDHYHADFIDDSDGDHNSFESQMERKYPILPEHGGPESGLWGGKWAPRPFESARLAAGLPTDHRTAAQFGPGHVPTHGFPITEGDDVNWIGKDGHPDLAPAKVIQYPAMGPHPDHLIDDVDQVDEFPYYDLALVEWGEDGMDYAEADEIVPRQHLDEYLRKFTQHGHPRFNKESMVRAAVVADFPDELMF